MSSSYQRHIDVLDDGRSFNVHVLKDQIYKVENELERDKKAIRKLLKSVNAVHSSIIEQSKNEKTLCEQLGNHAIALTTQDTIIRSLQVKKFRIAGGFSLEIKISVPKPNRILVNN